MTMQDMIASGAGEVWWNSVPFVSAFGGSIVWYFYVRCFLYRKAISKKMWARIEALRETEQWKGVQEDNPGFFELFVLWYRTWLEIKYISKVFIIIFLLSLFFLGTGIGRFLLSLVDRFVESTL